jgi:hypothetical protein
VRLEHIPKIHNSEANRLAQGVLGYRPILIEELSTEDWRKEIIDYLKYPSRKVDKQLMYKDIKYVLLEDELYYRTIDGVLLKCLGEEEAKILMGEIHEGVYGAHQSAFKMKWMIRNNSYYWPTYWKIASSITKDAKELHGEQPQRKTEGRDETYQWKLIRSIMRRFDYHSKDIKQISEQNDHLLRNWGACVDTVF